MKSDTNTTIIEKHKYIDSTIDQYISEHGPEFFGSRSISVSIDGSGVLKNLINNLEQPERESFVSSNAFLLD
ncbi:MAG: hypothetical protein AB8B89_04590 [Gammaproteobacteria bacterium]